MWLHVLRLRLWHLYVPVIEGSVDNLGSGEMLLQERSWLGLIKFLTHLAFLNIIFGKKGNAFFKHQVTDKYVPILVNDASDHIVTHCKLCNERGTCKILHIFYRD